MKSKLTLKGNNLAKIELQIITSLSLFVCSTTFDTIRNDESQMTGGKMAHREPFCMLWRGWNGKDSNCCHRAQRHGRKNMHRARKLVIKLSFNSILTFFCDALQSIVGVEMSYFVKALGIRDGEDDHRPKDPEKVTIDPTVVSVLAEQISRLLRQKDELRVPEKASDHDDFSVFMPALYKWLNDIGESNPLDPLLAFKETKGELSEREGDDEWNEAQKRFWSEVAAMKKHFQHCVLYVAPTGKAAAVMKKRTKKEAFTIHHILASYKAHLNSGSTNLWKYANTTILAIDESSMVSVELFSTLMRYLQRACKNLKKIVLLGDIHQLPSIDPGNFMADLHRALLPHGCVTELKTNHRSEGSLIFDNAKGILKGQMPKFDE